MSSRAGVASGGTQLEAAINEAIGHKVMLAMLSKPLWITRTVESVTFVDRHTVRRRQSVHYAIPHVGHRPIIPGTKLVRLPVYEMSKGQFLSCDLIDENKHAVSLPPLPERARLSAIVLRELAHKLLGKKDKDVTKLIEEFVTAGPKTCEEKLEQARSAPSMEKLWEHPQFDHLARSLAYNYIVFIDVPDEGLGTPPRRVIRFELDTRFPHKARELRERRELSEQQPGLTPRRWVTKPSGPSKWLPRPVRRGLRALGLLSGPYHHAVKVDGAGTLHLDIEATDGLALAHRELRLRAHNRIVYKKVARGASARRARFLVPRTKGTGEALMSIDIRPAPGLLRTAAPLLLLGFAILLWAAACEYDTLVKKPAAVSLLLLLPGLVSVVTAKPSEHPYVTSVLFGSRILAIMPIPLGILAAFVLLTKESQSILVVEAAVAGAAGLVLLLGRFIDELKVRPKFSELVEEDLTRIG